MKKLNLLFALIVGLTVLSCSTDDDLPPDTTPEYIGTYNLTSIVSNTELDPDVKGIFDDTEIMNNVDCRPLLILNTDNSFSWDYLTLNQIVNNVMGTTSYSKIECILFSGSVGQYQVNNNGISLVFDSSISNTNATLDGNTITVILSEELAVDNGGVVQLQDVQLTVTYTK